MGSHKSLMGELGFRFKANFNGILAAYLRASNNSQVSGTYEDFDFVRRTNPKIDATGTVSYGGKKYYNNYEGYLRSVPYTPLDVYKRQLRYPSQPTYSQNLMPLIHLHGSLPWRL